MSKVEYLILPKGTKFTGSGKLGLTFKGILKQDAELDNTNFRWAVYFRKLVEP